MKPDTPIDALVIRKLKTLDSTGSINNNFLVLVPKDYVTEKRRQ